MKVYESLNINYTCTTAVALGFFDGVHMGHRAVITPVIQSNLTPLVFTFTICDSSPYKKQGIGLLQTKQQRECILDSMGVVGLVMPSFELFKDMTPEYFAVEILYKKLNAKVICCGQDFRFGKGATGNVSILKDILTPLGVDVIVITPVLLNGEIISSTKIRELISSGNIGRANQLLGREFSIEGTVVHGKKLGRTIGFPTANQLYPKEMQIPRLGVYHTRVIIDNKHYDAVTNIGCRPTVDSDMIVNVESYIIGFSGEIYDKNIETRFLRFIRPEQRFETVELLKQAIKNDANSISGSI